ncbi:hypothetical protein JYU34_007915 [Plutella xylostella]|uniref:C2H2-type domain-containing protein n=1 Tax=Plutella xylostella TaxID=51655 RepID=A0ABQ7QNE4_PLUXY|nr:hypothetical protein JYU34_007915 [Plutella xylostella]
MSFSIRKPRKTIQSLKIRAHICPGDASSASQDCNCTLLESVDKIKFICDDCGRRYANKTKLRDHIEEKHLHKSYQCDICHKPSKNRVCLEQHVRNVHRGRALDKMCHHCGKGFPTKVQLESHIRSHTGERPFICEFCPTTFSQQSNLYKHNRQVI